MGGWNELLGIERALVKAWFTRLALAMDSHHLPLNVAPDVSPSSPRDEQPTIGLIGMGAMGRMYAKYFNEAGWKKSSP